MQLHELRASLLGDTSNRHPAMVDLGDGRSVEVRDPLYEDVEVLNSRYKDRPIAGILYIVVMCTYSNGARVFGLADMDALAKAPVGGWVGKLIADVSARVKGLNDAGNVPSASPTNSSST